MPGRHRTARDVTDNIHIDRMCHTLTAEDAICFGQGAHRAKYIQHTVTLDLPGVKTGVFQACVVGQRDMTSPRKPKNAGASTHTETRPLTQARRH